MIINIKLYFLTSSNSYGKQPISPPWKVHDIWVDICHSSKITNFLFEDPAVFCWGDVQFFRRITCCNTRKTMSKRCMCMPASLLGKSVAGSRGSNKCDPWITRCNGTYIIYYQSLLHVIKRWREEKPRPYVWTSHTSYVSDVCFYSPWDKLLFLQPSKHAFLENWYGMVWAGMILFLAIKNQLAKK